MNNTEVGNTLQSVLDAYGFSRTAVLTAFGSGLINHTWKLEDHGKLFILQKINDQVFRDPCSIENNIRMIAAYLKQNHPEYFFVAPVPSHKGKEMIHVEGDGFYRLFPFVPGSVSHDVVETPDQAYLGNVPA